MDGVHPPKLNNLIKALDPSPLPSVVLPPMDGIIVVYVVRIKMWIQV